RRARGRARARPQAGAFTERACEDPCAKVALTVRSVDSSNASESGSGGEITLTGSALLALFESGSRDGCEGRERGRAPGGPRVDARRRARCVFVLRPARGRSGGAPRPPRRRAARAGGLLRRARAHPAPAEDGDGDAHGAVAAPGDLRTQLQALADA